jgi:hypothetical protein
MPPPRPLRLPLEIGLAALQDLALGFLCIPPSLAVLGICIRVFIAAPDAGEAIGYVAVPALAVLIFGVTRLTRGWRYRPSDVVFDEKALRIDGGPNAGLSLPWSKLRAADCDLRTIVDPGKEKLIDTGDEKRWVLRLGGTDVAEADDAIEQASFREILSAVELRTATPEENADGDHGEKPTAEVRTLECPTCGALVAPSAAAESICAHCSAHVAIPDEIRKRVEAEATLPKARKRALRLVDRLLDQPGAETTTALLVLSFLFMAAAWPFTAWAYYYFWNLHRLTWWLGLALAALPFALIADGFFLSRLRLADRRALGTLTMAFGALPPRTKGGPLSCRSCLAPLPARDTTVVQCVFCGASNVTGVDLRAQYGKTQRSTKSLEDELEDRRRERWKWRLRTLASVPIFVGSALLVRHMWKTRPIVHAIESLDVRGSRPRPSHDGKSLLFHGEGGMEVLDLATGVTTPAPGVPRGVTLADWLPKGGFVYAVEGSPSVVRSTIVAGDLLTTNQNIRWLAVSADGKRMAIETSRGTDVTSTAITGLLLEQLDLKKRLVVTHATFAPDGAVVGLLSSSILIDRGNKHLKLIEPGGAPHAPSVSPDGRRVAFANQNGPSHDLFVVGADGFDLRPLTSDCKDCDDVAWGADGWLYFVRAGALARLRP